MNDIIPQKRCSKCKQFKAATTDNFQRDKTSPDNLFCQCKICRNTAKPSDIPSGHKRCSGCKEILPETTEIFSRAKLGKNGLAARCKACIKAHAQQRCEKRRDELRDKKRAYASTRKEETREYQRLYRLEHREELTIGRKEYHALYNLEHREQQNEWHRQNAQTPKGKMQANATYHRRRARKLSIGGSYTACELLEQLKRQKSCCYYCGIKFGKGKFAFEADHIIPLSRGGSNDISNIVLACAPCNRSKGSKLLHEWHKGNRLL